MLLKKIHFYTFLKKGEVGDDVESLEDNMDSMDINMETVNDNLENTINNVEAMENTIGNYLILFLIKKI